MVEVNLPRQRTSFVGRQHDLADVVRNLTSPSCQLLTLAGPGGVGKTRLALEVAAHLHDTFADGVYFIPLAPLASPDEILTTVISTLPFQPYGNQDAEQQLLNYLSTKQLLLVIDNVEHLLEGVMLVSEIVDVASQVKILTTSREPLNLQDEWIWHVRGMKVPEQTTDQLMDYSAVELFADRAQRVQRTFSLKQEREHVIRICQLVEGLPLALEIAAAWLKSLPCQAIADQIDHSIDFLTASARNVPDRHHSIRAVFDHSWQLLSAHEQAVFSKLSVFRGGLTIEAAEHVAGATLTDLMGLADKSLIQPGVGQRYDLHELLRQYGDEKFADDSDTLQEAHATYFAYFLSQREEDLKGRRQKAALDEIAADHENIRVAWLWAVQAYRYDLINAMIYGAHLYFYMRDRLQEIGQLRVLALKHFQAQIELNDPNFWPLLIRCPAYTITSDDLRRKQISDQIRQTFVFVERQGEPGWLSLGLKCLGHTHEAESDFENAIHYYEQSLPYFQKLDDGFHMGWMLQRLSVCYAAIGQWDRVYECSQRSLEISRRVGNQLHTARALYSLGSYTLYHTGDLIRASHYLQEAIAEQHEIENPWGIGLAIAELGYIAFLQEKIDTAKRLATEALAIADAINRSEIYSAALALQALLVALNGEDVAGQNLAIQSLDHTLIKYPTTVFWAQMALKMTTLGQNSCESQQLTNEMLQQASQARSPLLMACCLPFFALLFNDEQNRKRAVELLGLASNNLSAASGWLEHWQPIVDLRLQLIDELGTDTFETIWQRGTQLNLDTTIAGLSGHTNNPAHNGLVEPLSEREHEILQLIAEDLSNREIAKRLYITVGTVKSHNNHIFGKLGVKNRTEAIIHAQSLGLL